MTMSPTSFPSDITRGDAIPIGKRAYFQQRFRNRLYSMMVGEFLKRQLTEGLTQATIARRLNKRPEQIHRYLSAPGNLTLDTVSDLLLAIAGAELDCGILPLAGDDAAVADGPTADISGMDGAKSPLAHDTIARRAD